jgi:non-specific protein-tyrosine kinase
MESIDLAKIIRPLRKWWWLIFLAGAIAGMSSFAYLERQPSRYESRTTLVVGSLIQNPNPSGNELFLTQQLAAAYADFAQKGTVRQATMQALGMDWLPFYSTRADGQMLEISVIDDDPVRVQAVASELAHQIIQQSPAGQAEVGRQEFVTQRLQSLEEDILATEDEIDRKESELANELSASRISRLEGELSILENKLVSLQSTYAELIGTTQQGAVNAIHVLEAAGIPDQPLSKNYLQYVLVAVIFGMTLAAGAAYLAEFLDDSVKDAKDIQNHFGTVTLGAVPKLPGSDKAPEQRLIMIHDSLQPAAEAYRVLRTNLQFASVDRDLRLLQITSASPGEGKSMTAANLAAAIALSGKRVILLDADLRRPVQHKLFGLSNNAGVTSALLGYFDSLEQLLRPTPIQNLQVLTSGPLPPNPAELVGSKRMRSLLAQLQEHADMIVLDSPPITVVSDTTIMASYTEGVLLVVKLGHTRLDDLRRSIGALQQVEAHLLGVLLNEVPLKNSGYYYDYGYKYGYSYATAAERKSQGRRVANAEGSAGNSPFGRRSAQQSEPAPVDPILTATQTDTA